MTLLLDVFLLVLCFGLVVAVCQVVMTLGEEIHRDN